MKIQDIRAKSPDQLKGELTSLRRRPSTCAFARPAASSRTRRACARCGVTSRASDPVERFGACGAVGVAGMPSEYFKASW